MRDSAVAPAFVEPIVVKVLQSSSEIIAGWRQKYGPRTWSIRQVSQAKVDGRRGVIRSFEEQSRKLGQRGAGERKDRGHLRVQFRRCRGASLIPAPTLTRTRMHPFATYVLRSYYKATGWNEDNLYANFTRSSNGTRLILSSSLDADLG